MGYHLGVDLGTTYTAAAIERDGVVEMVNLGAASTATPSVLALEGGEFSIGEVAEARSLADPTIAAREFKRRLGDPAPMLVGASPYAPHLLMARLLEAVLAVVAERQGGPPDGVTLTHPANWGGFRRELFEEATRSVLDGIDVAYLSEPEAAAIDYAARARVPIGASVAVYDLGGGTFDAAILRRDADGFTILGEPRGVEHLGGIDFDAAVLGHVIDEAGIGDADIDDPATAAALQQLRKACTDAKVALSSSTDATIPVFVPGSTGAVRLTRVEFEAMIGPLLDESVKALERAVAGSGVQRSDIHSVLLVGGSSRIPLVAQRVTAALGRPVAVDADPKNAICRGAARAGLTTISRRDAAVAPVLPDPDPEMEPQEEAETMAPPGERAEDPPAAGDATAPTSPADSNRRRALAFVALVVVVLIGVTVAVFAGGDAGGDDPAIVTETAGDQGIDPFEPTGPLELLGASPVPGCTAPNTDGTLRIGLAHPQTGDFAFFLAIDDGATFAIEDINAAGGVAGQPVELLVSDTGTDAPAAIDDLVDRGADVVVGPVSSGEVLGSMATIRERCVVTISPSASSVSIGALDDDSLFFQASGTTEHVAKAAIELAEEAGATRVLVVGPGIDVVDRDAESELENLAEDAGIPVVVQPVAADATVTPDDFVLLTGLVDPAENAADIETLFAAGAGRNQIALVGLNLDDVTEVLTVPADGLRGITPIAAPPEGLVARTPDATAVDFTNLDYLAETYDVTVFLALAAQAAGSDDATQIARFLPEVTGVEPDGEPCSDLAACFDAIDRGLRPAYRGFTAVPRFNERGVPIQATIAVDRVQGGVVVTDERVVSLG